MNLESAKRSAKRSAKTPIIPSANPAIFAGVVLVGGIAGYLWSKSREYCVAPCTGGMKVGHDPRLINLDARYQDEGESERDVVDQAVYESFICSDPPAY